jgi:FAD/FMN-containing dehydrogenase
MLEQLPLTTADGRTASLLLRDLHALEQAIAGELIWPGHRSYDIARRIWNGLIDKRPGLIIRCTREEDVSASVRFARDHHLDLAVRGGGHNVAGRALSQGGVVIDLSPMRKVMVSAEGRSVTAEGGATLGDVDGATLPLGLAAPLGVVPSTGIAGYTLHGGYGWLSRRYGLAVDNLLSARVVTADGRILRASQDENADLFWAIRGGGGSFGAVTSFQYRLHRVGPMVWFALVIYPIDRAGAVLRVYRDYVAQAPDEVGAIAVCWSAPELAAVPEEARGAPALVLAAVHCGDDGEQALRPLREADRPLADLSARTAFIDVQRFFEPDYPPGRRYYWKSAYLPGLSDVLIDAAVEHTRERPSPLSSVDLWGLGAGAPSRVPVTETAFAQRHMPFMLAVEANWADPSADAENIAWARRVHGDAARAGGATYLNFPGLAEEGEVLVRQTFGPNYERLREIKAKYDPENLFRANFNIAPRAGG